MPGAVPREITPACGSGAVEVLQAQRPGRRPMEAAQLLRGRTLPGRFGA